MEKVTHLKELFNLKIYEYSAFNLFITCIRFNDVLLFSLLYNFISGFILKKKLINYFILEICITNYRKFCKAQG